MDYRTWFGHTEIDFLLSFVKLGGGKMTSSVRLLDVVALTVDLPEYNLWCGQVGTVVEILAGGTAFEVEFSDRNGRTYESLGLRPDQIIVLRYEPLTTPPPSVATPV